MLIEGREGSSVDSSDGRGGGRRSDRNDGSTSGIRRRRSVEVRNGTRAKSSSLVPGGSGNRSDRFGYGTDKSRLATKQAQEAWVYALLRTRSSILILSLIGVRRSFAVLPPSDRAVASLAKG